MSYHTVKETLLEPDAEYYMVDIRNTTFQGELKPGKGPGEKVRFVREYNPDNEALAQGGVPLSFLGPQVVFKTVDDGTEFEVSKRDGRLYFSKVIEGGRRKTRKSKKSKRKTQRRRR